MDAFAKFSLTTMIAIAPTTMAAADSPPADAKPVVEIVQRLEKEGYAPVTGFSFDDGNWEFEVSREGASRELTVDPMSGEILGEYADDVDPRPPKGAMPLSELLLGLQKAGYADVHEASFERRVWEIEIYRDGAERELQVDPITGKVTGDRAD